MPYITGTIQPAGIGFLRCTRCWFSGPFIPLAALVLRCSRCEWPFTVAAATAPVPSVPASTVGYTNASGSPLSVALSTFTLTSVVVNGTQAGTTNATYYVPAAGVISVTYTVAGTWTWALITATALTGGNTSISLTHGGAVFAAPQVLVIDAAGSPDIVTVNGATSDTSIPCTSLAASHSSGKTVSVVQLAPQLGGVGQDQVPANAY